jgi:hypothetical protein
MNIVIYTSRATHTPVLQQLRIRVPSRPRMQHRFLQHSNLLKSSIEPCLRAFEAPQDAVEIMNLPNSLGSHARYGPFFWRCTERPPEKQG